jgi:hypothetical protein
VGNSLQSILHGYAIRLRGVLHNAHQTENGLSFRYSAGKFVGTFICCRQMSESAVNGSFPSDAGNYYRPNNIPLLGLVRYPAEWHLPITAS